MNEKVFEKQVGGTHYKSEYQPIMLMEHVNMCPSCAFVLKYVYRHKMKGGKQDLQKALQCCDFIEKFGGRFYMADDDKYNKCFYLLAGNFYNFINKNPQLDLHQVKAILAICHKDIDGLREAIHAEMEKCYEDSSCNE